MSRLLRTLPLAFGLLIAACSEGTDSDLVAPGQPDLAGGKPDPATLACNSSVFPSLVNTYFNSPTRKQEAQGYVNLMTATPYEPAAQDNGFNVMDLMAAEVKGGNSAASTGNTLTRELIKCMYDATDSSSDFPANFATLDFTSSLDPAVPGAFEVRGPSTSRTPVASRAASPVERLSGVAPPEDPAAPGTALPWSSILSQRALIYGAPVALPFPSTGYSKDEYQWEAIRPSVSFGGNGATVALCDPSSTSSSMVHESNFGVLAYTDGNYICDAVYSSIVQGWSPRVLVHRLLKFVTPEPLSAATRTIGGSAGGLKSFFSKKTISSAGLKFLSLLPSATPKVNSPITVTVEARSSDLALMNGVTVTLTGTNNNGTLTKLVQSDGTTCSTNTPPSGVTGTKDVGVVEIKFCVTKTGGLLLTGTGNVSGRSITVTNTKPAKLNVKP